MTALQGRTVNGSRNVNSDAAGQRDAGDVGPGVGEAVTVRVADGRAAGRESAGGEVAAGFEAAACKTRGDGDGEAVGDGPDGKTDGAGDGWIIGGVAVPAVTVLVGRGRAACAL